jgi:hypothetical protein
VANRVSVEVDGDEKLGRAFDRAADDIGPRTERVERDEGEAVARGARSRAPRRKGALRGSVRSVGGVVTAGDSGVPYAGPIHFGWASRPNPARGWRGGPISPNPFLYDALDDRRQHAEHAFAEATSEVVGMVNRT